MHGLNQFPLANVGGVCYLLGLFTVTVNRFSWGRGHFPSGSFLQLAEQNKVMPWGRVCVCVNVHLCATWDLRPVQLINCKIHKVFEADSGLKLQSNFTFFHL